MSEQKKLTKDQKKAIRTMMKLQETLTKYLDLLRKIEVTPNEFGEVSNWLYKVKDSLDDAVNIIWSRGEQK